MGSDDTTLQASFADKFGLSYPIVSDVGDKLRRAYKVEGFIFGLAPGAYRVPRTAVPPR